MEVSEEVGEAHLCGCEEVGAYDVDLKCYDSYYDNISAQPLSPQSRLYR